ncbi:bifunctional 4-hydroxy-2-oxoglutarate aldolase/2-dehydro-3-deoxy-phosphogluconate aldolase [Alkalicoccus urumqiensis]|uniref:2-dehydro-3-deoxyphosphogluconate aldolase n=1 Tax=Alkalicoccus urumqiensis TaxID=1548213 RepID=A0A2P6MJ43_ALKUR|nr:bifunctional 4-hydroxy-2-oxoglutarate aldolase/2-dehydro-3-deoxy-phosphogluconate aldolase [Alkalicoccus urumqiensis]PRO66308.1 2-dehydro-3-deoxyphosphogluconate aldolase [Alkalicoccus urumqiensis]
MDKQQVLEHVLETKLVAVIRGHRPDTIGRVVEALADGGVTTMEITADSPDAAGMVREAVERVGDRAVVGAGTVLDGAQADAMVDAGAQFIFSPDTWEETIKTAVSRGVVSIPGAITPTEITTALRAGADIIKVFPADQVGTSFFKAMQGPLPHVKLMPTGGVRLSNMTEFLDAGACAVGLGTSLIRGADKDDPETIRQEAARYRQAVDDWMKAGEIK